MREGCVFKYVRSGKTKYGIKLPIENSQGLPTWKYRYGFTTKKEASAEFRRLRNLIDENRDPFPANTRFSDYASDYLRHRRADGLRGTTVLRYERLLRDDILPVVGSLPLRRISPAHVRLVMDNMKGRGLSRSTIVQGRAVFSGVMKQAVAEGLADSNPVSAISRPRDIRSQKGTVPSPAQVRAIVDASEGTVWGIPILLAATTGARRSEISGLCWDDLDWSTGKLRIQRGLHWIPTNSGRVLEFLPPKTGKARRTVQLLPSVLERLKQHRKSQLERRMALAEAWNAPSDMQLICDAGNGSPIDPDLLTKNFKRLVVQIGLDPSIRLHDLRHGVATQLARAGVHPHAVSTVMGHSSVAFTMDVYTQAWAEGADEAADAIGEALNL